MISNANVHFEENKSFEKNHLNFLIQRKSLKYRRSLFTTNTSEFKIWFAKYLNIFDSTLKNAKQIQKIKLLFEIWKNLFIEDVKHMSITNLIEHHIFIYSNLIFIITRSILYIAEKI